MPFILFLVSSSRITKVIDGMVGNRGKAKGYGKMKKIKWIGNDNTSLLWDWICYCSYILNLIKQVHIFQWVLQYWISKVRWWPLRSLSSWEKYSWKKINNGKKDFSDIHWGNQGFFYIHYNQSTGCLRKVPRMKPRKYIAKTSLILGQRMNYLDILD